MKRVVTLLFLGFFASTITAQNTAVEDVLPWIGKYVFQRANEDQGPRVQNELLVAYNTPDNFLGIQLYMRTSGRFNKVQLRLPLNLVNINSEEDILAASGTDSSIAIEGILCKSFQSGSIEWPLNCSSSDYELLRYRIPDKEGVPVDVKLFRDPNTGSTLRYIIEVGPINSVIDSQGNIILADSGDPLRIDKLRFSGHASLW